MFKRIVKSKVVTLIAGFLVSTYIRLVHATTRWTYVGQENYDALAERNTGIIFAFWHNRLLMGANVRKQTQKRVFMLISAHRDGEIIAKGVRPFGVEFIRGSAANPKKRFKDKNGASALTQMIAVLKNGSFVGITPDGPRGPRMKAQIGVIKLSFFSGAPILPTAYSTSNGWFLKTWDRFFLAAPFSRGYYVGGPPIEAPTDKSPEKLEEKRQELEAALKMVTATADRLAGRISPEIPEEHR